MSEWILSLEGTHEGHNIALVLALGAAFLHALFGALQKGKHDPWLSRGAMDFSYGIIAAPIALFVVPWPEPHMWIIFLGMFVIHVIYKLAQAYTYTLGDYTVVYPVVRGMGPLFTVVGAGIVFGEHFTLSQWFGVFVLLCGIFGLAGYNLLKLQGQRSVMVSAILMAMFTGMFVALYTTYDAYGIRSTADPFTFLAWFFFIDGLLMPVIALRRYKRMENKPDLAPLMLRGLIGGLVAYGSFGFIMLATRLDNVGEAAVLRETSAVFAALIGWVLLKEKVGPQRLGFMSLIALGAIIVEFSA